MRDAATRELLTYDEYLRLSESAEGFVEYHDGRPALMVAPSPEHARIAARLVQSLGASLSGRTCQALAPGLKVRVEATNHTFVPDVTVVCGSLERSAVDPRAITNPLVIIEVLSPSTEDYDRGSKLHHYRRIPSLDEYVLVAQEERSIVIMRRSGDLWSFDDVGPEGMLRLASLDIELPTDAIYRDPLGVIVPVE